MNGDSLNALLVKNTLPDNPIDLLQTILYYYLLSRPLLQSLGVICFYYPGPNEWPKLSHLNKLYKVIKEKIMYKC